MKSQRTLLWTLALLTGLIGATGCSNDDGASPAMGTVRLSVTRADAAPVAKAAPGDITITRARFLLRRIVLKDANEVEVDYSAPPRVVELALDGTVNPIAIASVPMRTYDEVRFDVHRLDDTDPVERALLLEPEFADFGGDDRASMIIEGTYDDGGSAVAFTFFSRVNDQQRSALVPPLTIDAETTVANVTLAIDVAGWFVDGQEGRLDPRNPDHANLISDNLRSSIDVFRDDDRDGVRD